MTAPNCPTCLCTDPAKRGTFGGCTDPWHDTPVRPTADPACTGASRCRVAVHFHGCYADLGSCDEPEAHRPNGYGGRAAAATDRATDAPAIGAAPNGEGAATPSPFTSEAPPNLARDLRDAEDEIDRLGGVQAALADRLHAAEQEVDRLNAQVSTLVAANARLHQKLDARTRAGDNLAVACPRCGSDDPGLRLMVPQGGRLMDPCHHPWHDTPDHPDTVRLPTGVANGGNGPRLPACHCGRPAVTTIAGHPWCGDDR